MKKTQNTPYPELNTVLNNLAKRLKDELKDNFIGFYLQGSLATGDFDMTSDIDFIVVTDQGLSDKQVEAVQRIHTETYNQSNRWVKRLEYSFFPKDKLNVYLPPFMGGKANGSEERLLWYFDNGSKTIEKSDHCNTLVVRWSLREKGIALFGPDPKTLIDPIDPDGLRGEIKDTIIGWGEYLLNHPKKYKNRFYQSYLVLNYARMLNDLHQGSIASKLKGIVWAKSNLDPKWIPLIDFCWKERQDTEISVKQPADEDIFPKSIEFVKYAIQQAKKYEINSPVDIV